jgi:hypothetical protein
MFFVFYFFCCRRRRSHQRGILLDLLSHLCCLFFAALAFLGNAYILLLDRYARGRLLPQMKQPKLLPGKKRKLTAYEVRKLTRRRHITWQRLGREYNTHFPYEKSGELPGAGDRIVPNAEDIVKICSEYDSVPMMPHNSQTFGLGQGEPIRDRDKFFEGRGTIGRSTKKWKMKHSTIEKYINVNNKTMDRIEDEKNNKSNNMASTSPIIRHSVHSPHSYRRRRTPTIIIQSLWRGAIIRKKVTNALSYEQLKKRATLRRFSKHRMEIERAKAKNRRIFKAAAMLQKYIRGFKARKAYRKKFRKHFGAYALKIQQLTRSFLSKNERQLRFQARRFESMVLRLKQVVSVQCWYRSMVAYKIYKKLRTAKDNLMYYQNHCNLQAKLWTEHILNTALFKARRKRKKQLEENIEKFVGFIPVQAHFRGWRARLAYKQKLIDIEDLKILRWNCAIKIQARWRVRYGKIALKQLIYEKNDEMARLVWMKQAYPDEVDDVINEKGKYRIETNEYKRVIIRKSPTKAVKNKIIKDLQMKNKSINKSNKNSTFRLLETNEDDFYQWSSSSDNEEDDDNSPRYW